MNLKPFVLLLFVSFLIASSCKKYEEGPLISFRSPYKRIAGSHTLITYTVDGADSLSQFYDSLGMHFKIDYDREGLHLSISTGLIAKGMLNCRWYLDQKETVLRIIAGYGKSGIGALKPGLTSDWEILRLTNKDSKMKTSYNGKEYLMELKKSEKHK